MKKRTVINVPMHNDKAKSKAMKIAVASPGVVSVSIGEENDVLVVIGEGVDSVSLANSLRKKFCFADILSLDDVKPPAPDPTPPPSPEKSPPPQCCPPPPYCKPVYYESRVVYDDTPNCSMF